MHGVWSAYMAEDHRLPDGNDSVEIAQSFKLGFFAGAGHIELQNEKEFAVFVLYALTSHLLDVVEGLFVPLKSHNDRVRDHHGRELHHLLIVCR